MVENGSRQSTEEYFISPSQTYTTVQSWHADKGEDHRGCRSGSNEGLGTFKVTKLGEKGGDTRDVVS